jgi:hypothetical protein
LAAMCDVQLTVNCRRHKMNGPFGTLFPSTAFERVRLGASFEITANEER